MDKGSYLQFLQKYIHYSQTAIVWEASTASYLILKKSRHAVQYFINYRV